MIVLNVSFAHVPGEVKPGLPALAPPPFSATVGNHTYTFMEMASTLGSAIFVVPLLSILENIALAKVFCECLTFFWKCKWQELRFASDTYWRWLPILLKYLLKLA